MELREFIKSSLVDITKGVMDAGEALKDTNAIISPHNFKIDNKDPQIFGRTKDEGATYRNIDGTRVVHKVDFDIAVVVDASDKKQAGLKVAVMSLGLSGGGESTNKAASTSRIKFSVPVVMSSSKSDKD
ncbi:hypothetical protein FM038_017305 [Shewanella eurypsychrophilus]|uniref:Uncharacterized protein n=1 Tax=Shewanella eurypsychrophilus TaxID=2593656 RepID=A0ABX6V8H5_9GAMM|nr:MULTISPECIES: trypco2 family protein [Shewanella]QFU23755.1 hypothetical protein FS418_19085 [Shewanella sp. YLB-09]QPG58978.1 hypothetical protein FM038_017305 [Shewanella eurypsychrophilus]